MQASPHAPRASLAVSAGQTPPGNPALRNFRTEIEPSSEARNLARTEQSGLAFASYPPITDPCGSESELSFARRRCFSGQLGLRPPGSPVGFFLNHPARIRQTTLGEFGELRPTNSPRGTPVGSGPLRPWTLRGGRAPRQQTHRAARDTAGPRAVAAGPGRLLLRRGGVVCRNRQGSDRVVEKDTHRAPGAAQPQLSGKVASPGETKLGFGTAGVGNGGVGMKIKPQFLTPRNVLFPIGFPTGFPHSYNADSPHTFNKGIPLARPTYVRTHSTNVHNTQLMHNAQLCTLHCTQHKYAQLCTTHNYVQRTTVHTTQMCTTHPTAHRSAV